MTTDDDALARSEEEVTDQLADPAEAAEDTDQSDSGSLKTLKSEDPRKKFLEQFSSDDDAETPEGEVAADDEGEAGEGEAAEEEAAEAAGGEAAEEEEEAPDLGVDLSGLDIAAEDDADTAPVDEGFDPKAELPKKVWTGLPAEAQKLITNHRRHAKALQRQIDAEKPQAEFTRNLLASAEKAQVSNDELVGWINLGLRLQHGDEAATKTLGEIAQKAGWAPPAAAAAELDLAPIQSYLQQQVEEFNLSADMAKAILEKAKEAKKVDPAPAPAAQPPARARAPQMAAPDQGRAELEHAALNKIAEIDSRFAKKFGQKWPQLRDRVRREMILAQAETPVGPAQWPSRWLAKAQEIAAESLKRSKAQKKQRMQGGSDGLERSAITAPPTKDSNTATDKSRREFLKQYTR